MTLNLNDSNVPTAGTPGDALHAGGVVKISTDLLNNFANGNLQSFINDMGDEPSLQALLLFTEGSPGDGPMPSGAYDLLLPGNTGKGGSGSNGN